MVSVLGGEVTGYRLLDAVLTWLGEILSQSLMKVKGLHEHKLMENGSQSKEIKYMQKRCNILLE